MVLLAISAVRELLGMGTILGLAMPFFSTQWDKWIIMVMPPGAFFTLATALWILRSIRPGEVKK
jgi:Na+-transporting NADH:ubiquinone oxidoreductase subunit D